MANMCFKPGHKLTPHFSLAEMTVTQQHANNQPKDYTTICNLRNVAFNVLEKVRAHYGKRVIVHSGYRSPEVNRLVGGSATSQHCKGMAADFHVEGLTVVEVAVWIKHNIPFDQLILENFIPNSPSSGWVHCSWVSGTLRKMALTKFRGSHHYHGGLILTPGGETL